MFEEVSKNRKFEYVRVSSQTQQNNSSLEAQKQEFIQKGVPEKNIRVKINFAADKIQDRPVFSQIVDELKENDLLFATKMDRCSRNTLESLKLQNWLYKKEVRFVSLDLPYSTDMAVNPLTSTNLATIAIFENERWKDRQRQGIKATKKNRLTFESEKLVINYFEFKFDVLPESIKQKIVQSFFKLVSNFFDGDKKYRNVVQYSLQTNSKNQYQI